MPDIVPDLWQDLQEKDTHVRLLIDPVILAWLWKLGDKSLLYTRLCLRGVCQTWFKVIHRNSVLLAHKLP